MAADLKPLQDYIHTIEKKLASGDATEHTHRSALETLVESLDSEITATNEPKHIECGAPDFILRKGSVTVGYIEAKDIGKSLDETEKSEQLSRYRDSLPSDLDAPFCKRGGKVRLPKAGKQDRRI